MTINVELPYNSLLGDGSLTTFPFTFSLTEEYDLYVTMDGEQLVEYSDYTIENVTDDGGEVEFAEAPDDGAVILIFRFTTRSQQVDYVSGEPFPAETHEKNGLDKHMRILQELILGTFNGIGEDGEPYQLTFDLSVTRDSITVTIVNSGGTDATIPMWTNAEFAGVYAGEYGPEASLPADEEATAMPDGYIWLGY